jgi:transposase
VAITASLRVLGSESIRERSSQTVSGQRSYERALKKYKTGDMIIESVGFYQPVPKFLHDRGCDVHLAHLRAVKKERCKSDKRDAERNLRLYQGKALAEAYVPPEAVWRLRDIARHRMFIVNLRSPS